jgi:hypothetical protein
MVMVDEDEKKNRYESSEVRCGAVRILPTYT